MDKKYIEENEIERRYLLNKLDDKELETFEVYLMEHSEALESLSIETLLIENVSAVKSQRNNLVTKWLSTTYKRVVAYSFVLTSLIIVFAFYSFKQGDKEIDLFLVRSGSESLPILERSIGQKYWPLLSEIDLKAPVPDSQSFSSAVVEILQLDSGTYQTIRSYKKVSVTEGGYLVLDIKLSSLVEGHYRVVLKQGSELTNDERRNWIYEFKVK